MAPPTAPAQATLVDKLGLFPLAGASVASAVLRLVTRSFVGGQANGVFKDFVYAAVRTLLTNISAGAEQWMNGTTEAEYLALAKKHGFQPDTDVLGSGMKAHWIGNKTAEKVLLYFHGGGYVLAATPGHLQWLYELQQDLSKSTNFSIVLLSYTLAPHGQYPLQLQQAAESLEWLVETKKLKPSNIFIGGDSAGGNMTMMLISHLLHPHSAVKSSNKLSEPLGGAILISPWVKFAAEDNSVTRNAYTDYVTPHAANRWSSSFMGSAKLDNYNQAILADADWFKDLDGVVKDILVWGGSGEILIDSIEGIRKTLQQAHPRVEYVLEANASHEEFIFERGFGYTHKAEGTTAIESWMKARL